MATTAKPNWAEDRTGCERENRPMNTVTMRMHSQNIVSRGATVTAGPRGIIANANNCFRQAGSGNHACGSRASEAQSDRLAARLQILQSTLARGGHVISATPEITRNTPRLPFCGPPARNTALVAAHRRRKCPKREVVSVEDAAAAFVLAGILSIPCVRWR